MKQSSVEQQDRFMQKIPQCDYDELHREQRNLESVLEDKGK